MTDFADTNLHPEQSYDYYPEIKSRGPECQANAVYNWEYNHFPESQGACLWTLPECQLLVDKVWSDFSSSKSPTVLDGRGSSNARAWVDRIMLPRWARNQTVVLHELAHCLVYLINLEDSLNHSGMFVHVLCLLLSQYGVEKYCDLKASVQLNNILITPIKLKHRIRLAHI